MRGGIGKGWREGAGENGEGKKGTYSAFALGGGHGHAAGVLKSFFCCCHGVLGEFCHSVLVLPMLAPVHFPIHCTFHCTLKSASEQDHFTSHHTTSPPTQPISSHPIPSHAHTANSPHDPPTHPRPTHPQPSCLWVLILQSDSVKHSARLCNVRSVRRGR